MIREKAGEIRTREMKDKVLRGEWAGMRKVSAALQAYAERVVAELVEEIGEDTGSNPQILQFIRETAMVTVHQTIEAAGALMGADDEPEGNRVGTKGGETGSHSRGERGRESLSIHGRIPEKIETPFDTQNKSHPKKVRSPEISTMKKDSLHP